MHPIEHLRALARAGDPAEPWLVTEAAEALAALSDDRRTLVLAARTLLDHLPLCGPLWWLCSRMLLADDPLRSLDESLEQIGDDATLLHVSLAMSEVGDLEPALLDAWIAGPDGAVGSLGVPDDDRPVWLVAARGTVVPVAVLRDARSRAAGQGLSRFVPTERISRVIDPSGVSDGVGALGRPEFSVAPELLART